MQIVHFPIAPNQIKLHITGFLRSETGAKLLLFPTLRFFFGNEHIFTQPNCDVVMMTNEWKKKERKKRFEKRIGNFA